MTFNEHLLLCLKCGATPGRVLPAFIAFLIDFNVVSVIVGAITVGLIIITIFTVVIGVLYIIVVCIIIIVPNGEMNRA